MNKSALILVGLVLSSVALAMTMRGNSEGRYWGNTDYDPGLKFSHTLHVQEKGIACEDCHTNVTKSSQSSDNLIGDHQSCTTCHEEQISNNCQYCHASKENIAPVKAAARELMFSHERHTTTLKLPCGNCHVGVESTTLATSANMPSMASCITCHNEKNAAIQCETCHTDFVSLTPADHLLGEFRRHHRDQVRVGITEVSCKTCHSQTFCQDCHTGMELKDFDAGKDLTTEPSSRSSVKDSPKQLKLQQVHGLNYRFTHGVDAKSKAMDCSSCHEQQSFCATCHEAGGNISEGKFKPASHTVAGFTTIGRGTGGGRHAELGRRDIESCISCHDVQGNDPTCALCHTENGVR